VAKKIFCVLGIVLSMFFTSTQAYANADYFRISGFYGKGLEKTSLGYDKVNIRAWELETQVGKFLNKKETLFVDLGVKYLRFKFSDCKDEGHADNADYFGTDIGVGYIIPLKGINANITIRAYAGLGYLRPEENVSFLADHGVTGDLGFVVTFSFAIGNGWELMFGPAVKHRSKVRQRDPGGNPMGASIGVKKKLKNGLFKAIKNLF